MNWIEEVNDVYQEKLRRLNLPIEPADISVLDERQQEALRLRYGEKLQLREIGDHLGVKEERARQIVILITDQNI